MTSWDRTLIGIALVAGTLVAAAPAAGQPAAGQSVTGQPAAEEGASPQHVSTVTLVTGDRVDVSYGRDGTPLATLRPRDDGSRAVAKIVADGADVYVIPQDALPHVATGALDRELFNVTGLVAAGHDDGVTPMIVKYRAGSFASARLADSPVLDDVDQVATLDSIDAVAVTVDEDRAAAFWGDLTRALDEPATASRAAAGGIEKVWLDPTLTADLTESVGQIGAPQAWAAGFDGSGTTVAVLDTGYDAAHPDLAGQVTAAQDFSGTGVADGHGHGTHVAATVAGSGGAGTGHVGVAPGADLLIGKVMGNDGTGMGSWLIDGMEWAVSQGADVVNMSLSTEVTDGSDPLSQAVNALSASSGTLFVATSGNTGPDQGTARAPGNADAALSVAAVDKSDVLAAFSSRGPRFGDGALKPDIAAPGVNIVAARAAGTSLGTPVSETHTMLSGTSMAAPHVAGSAAIVKQAHPEWDGERIKAALMGSSTAVDDADAFGVGAGRVDVARAVSQQVTSRPASVSFGAFPWTEDERDPVVTTITYDNHGDADLDLDLVLDASIAGGGAAPDGMATLGASSVTVPAHGTAEVTLTLDPNLGDPALYHGHVLAMGAGGQTVRTVFGAVKEPELVDVVIEGINQDGSVTGGGSSVDLWNLDTDETYTAYFGGKGGPAPAVLSVPVGTYSLMSFLWTSDDAARYGREVAMVSLPELTLTEDTTMTLDATSAQPLNPITPRPAESRELTLGYYRTAGEHTYAMHYLMDEYVDAAYVTATDPVSRGDFEVSAHWELLAPEFVMTLQGRKAPIAAEYTIGSPRIDGRSRFMLADAGHAAPEDLTGRDLTGTVALIERSDAIAAADQIQAVADAGAAAAVVYHDQPGFLLESVPESSPIPSFTMEQEPGRALVAAAAGRSRVDVVGTPESPYAYDLFPYYPDQVPATIDRTVDHRDLAEVQASYYGTGGDQSGLEVNFPSRPHDSYVIRQALEVPLEFTRTEWVTPGEIEWQQVSWPTPVQEGAFVSSPRHYAAGQRTAEDWFAPVVRPGVPAVGDANDADWGLPGFREDDTFTIQIRSMLDGGDHYTEKGGDLASRLYRDGHLVAERGSLEGTWPAGADPADYRLELDVAPDVPWWSRSTRTETAWEFSSSRPGAGEREHLDLLQIDYDAPAGLGAAVPGRPTTLGLRVYQQTRPDQLLPVDITVQLSYDGGVTWNDADKVRRVRDGSYRVTVRPARDASTVSLRVRADGPDGAAIEQTVIDAYRVAGS